MPVNSRITNAGLDVAVSSPTSMRNLYLHSGMVSIVVVPMFRAPLNAT